MDKTLYETVQDKDKPLLAHSQKIQMQTTSGLKPE